MKWLLSLLGLSYLISPYDLFPDMFVGVGWIDDLIILGLLWWYLYVYRKRRYGYERAGAEGDPHPPHGEGEQAESRNTAEPKDPYAVLGVPKGASAVEIGAVEEPEDQRCPHKGGTRVSGPLPIKGRSQKSHHDAQ